MGQEVYKISLNPNLETQELNLNMLQSGVYLVKIIQGNNLTTKRLVLE